MAIEIGVFAHVPKIAGNRYDLVTDQHSFVMSNLSFVFSATGVVIPPAFVSLIIVINFQNFLPSSQPKEVLKL